MLDTDSNVGHINFFQGLQKHVRLSYNKIRGEASDKGLHWRHI
jgi:hypothetical protein